MTNDYLTAQKDIQRSQIVCASAGTGKTRVLVDRYMEIVGSAAAVIPQIVAITFTEKAAGEMRERIRAELVKAEQFSEPQKLKLIDTLATAPISTVHSFCSRLIQDNYEQAGIDPLFRIVDEVEESILRRDALDRFIHRKLESKDPAFARLLEYLEIGAIAELFQQAWQLQNEVFRYIEKVGLKPESDLVALAHEKFEQHTLETLRKIFEDTEGQACLREIDRLSCPDPEDKLWQAFGTIRAAAEAVQSGKIPAACFDNNLARAFSGSIKGNAKKWGDQVEHARAVHDFLNRRWKTIKDDILPYDEDIEKNHIRVLIPFLTLAGEFMDSYRALLKANSQMDFAGLEREALRLTSGDDPSMRDYLGRYTHLLVDEFQDINPIQNAILQNMQRLNPQLITFFVGDEKQSIYRFRGAEVEIFNRLQKTSAALRLNRNFRSTAPLMAFFNELFHYLLGQEASAEEYEVNYPIPIEPHFKSSEVVPAVELLLVKDDEEAEDGTKDAAALSDPQAEATLVAMRMAALHGRPIVKIKDQAPRAATWNDMVVLLRSRTHQPVFESIFQKAGIPFYVLSGQGFYEKREIQDVINFLRVLLNFYDEAALVGALRSPMFGVSDYTLYQLSEEDRLLEGLKKYFRGEWLGAPPAPSERELLDRFHRIYTGLSDELQTLSIGELIDAILQRTDYLAIVSSLSDGHRQKANLNKLVDLALEWSVPENISPIDFIRRVQIYRSLEAREGEANLVSELNDSVTIMTIHAAKGLDFPIVFIPRLASRINVRSGNLLENPKEGLALRLSSAFGGRQAFMFEYLKRLDSRRVHAEEKRLLYVAATRAASYLVLSAVDDGKRREDKQGSLWAYCNGFLDHDRPELFTKTIMTKSGLFEKFRQLYAGEEKSPQKLTGLQINQIRELGRAPEFRMRHEKITATEFAEWVAGKFSPPRPITIPIGKIWKRALTPLELGSVIHKAFSWWDFEHPEALRESIRRLLAPYYLDAAEEEQIRREIEPWIATLSEAGNPLRELLARSRRIDREIEVVGLYSDVIIEGKIDLLLHNSDDSYVIVDFKSDRVGAERDEDLLHKYDAQLGLYAFILEKWSRLKVSRHALYFIRTGSLVKRIVDGEYLAELERKLQQFIRSDGN